MFTTENWPAISRKREREDEDDDMSTMGFSAHRDKRHLSALPFRSPNLKRYPQPQTLSQFELPPGFQAPSTITPADSSNESSPTKQDCEDKSFFSPYSSPPVIVQSGPSSPMRQGSLSFSISSSSQDTAMYSDHEMTDRDSYNLSPGPYQPDLDFATTIRERIPTPRHTNFFTSSYMENTDSHPRGSLPRQTVRLPSPISEGEPSPSLQLGGLAYVSMEIEPPSSPAIPSFITTEEAPSPSPHKKGHSRSKHSLRDWSGISGAVNSGGGKKKFSMGYRSDCEKCRNGVPGHYNHIYME